MAFLAPKVPSEVTLEDEEDETVLSSLLVLERLEATELSELLSSAVPALFLIALGFLNV